MVVYVCRDYFVAIADLLLLLLLLLVLLLLLLLLLFLLLASVGGDMIWLWEMAVAEVVIDAVLSRMFGALLANSSQQKVR